jgi:hypothetical protein
VASIIVAWFSRQREFRADRGSAQIMGTPRPMIAALRRLGGLEQGELPKNMAASGIAGGGMLSCSAPTRPAKSASRPCSARFVFAFPNVLPAPPGTSAILGLPLVFLAAQLAFRLPPWLPGFIARRSMPRQSFRTLVQRMRPWLQRAERLLRPRASVLALPPMEYAVGLLCLLLAIVVLLPIPMGNMLPALSISLLALGILERDGFWIVAGLAAAVAAAALVSGVILMFIKTAIYFLGQYLT